MNASNANLPSMLTERAWFATTTHGRRIFVMGGSGRRYRMTSTAEMFNIDTQQWTAIPSMSTGHDCCAAVTLDDNVIAMGCRTAEQFNVISKQWSPFPSMNTIRDRFAAAVVDGKIIVVGGYEDVFDGECLATVEEFDPSTGEWREITPMHCKRYDCATAVLDGKLYVVGGYDGNYNLPSAEVYDPNTQQWTLLNDMTTRRRYSAAVPLAGRIFVVGGYDADAIDRRAISSFEVYDPKTQKWSCIASMHTKRCGCAAVGLGGNIFVLGGLDKRNQCLSSMEYLPLSAFFIFLLEDQPDRAKELGIDDKYMPAFLSVVGDKSRLLTFWKVIQNRQDLLNVE